MRTTLHSLLMASALAALPLAGPALAHQTGHDGHAEQSAPSAGMDEVQAGDLHISGGFARATLPRAPVGGAYLTIRNDGAGDDRLTGAAATLAGEVQIHMMEHKDGVMTMRQLRDGLVIPAGASVALEPGGAHLMLMGLSEPLVEGQSVEIRLQFEEAGEVTVGFDIVALNARAAPGASGADHGGHDHSHDPGHDDGHDDGHGHGHDHEDKAGQ